MAIEIKNPLNYNRKPSVKKAGQLPRPLGRGHAKFRIGFSQKLRFYSPQFS